MPESLLHRAPMHTTLQQVRRVRMPPRVNGRVFGQSAVCVAAPVSAQKLVEIGTTMVGNPVLLESGSVSTTKGIATL